MGILSWIFNVYVAIALLRTADKWICNLVTRHVYEESETFSFLTINFDQCTGHDHVMCRNIVRSQTPIYTGRYSYTVLQLTTFSFCQNVPYAIGMIGDTVHWTERAGPGGAFLTSGNAGLFYGAQIQGKTFPSHATDRYVEFAVWFLNKLDNATLMRCRTDENDDPFVYWRYAISVNSPLTEWTGIEWFNLITKREI